MNPKNRPRKPKWLRAKLPSGPAYSEVREIVDQNQLHTVCQSAQCPNMGECWSRGTATLMILGNVCTRACTFCAVQTGKPTELDLAEPPRVADAVAKNEFEQCMLTSVRDDLPRRSKSLGSNHLRFVIETQMLQLKSWYWLQGEFQNLDLVLDANPDIFNRLKRSKGYRAPSVRPQATREVWMFYLIQKRDSN